MKIELLSITKSSRLKTEEQTANVLADCLRQAREFHNCAISVVKVERPPEGSLPFRRFKYDIIIEGDCPESVITSLSRCAAYTHYTVNGKMYQTDSHAQFLNLISKL